MFASRLGYQLGKSVWLLVVAFVVRCGLQATLHNSEAHRDVMFSRQPYENSRKALAAGNM